jgi:hypothetical protein
MRGTVGLIACARLPLATLIHSSVDCKLFNSNWFDTQNIIKLMKLISKHETNTVILPSILLTRQDKGPKAELRCSGGNRGSKRV